MPGEAMKSLGGGGGSFSKTSSKALSKPVNKPKGAPKKLSHSQLVAKWEAQGGKFAVEEKKAWTKSDIEHARQEKERALKEKADEAKGVRKPEIEEQDPTTTDDGPKVMAASLARPSRYRGR